MTAAALRLLPIEARIRESGESRPGKCAACVCGCVSFSVYQLDGQDHPHLQCAACGMSYCHHGHCGRGATGH